MEDPVMHELTAAYALDALEPDEARSYESHLGGCEPCREELAEFGQLVEALAYAAPSATPSPSLRRRILAASGLEDRRRRRRPRWALPSLALAAAASCAAVALGIWIATEPGGTVVNAIALHGASGALVVSGDRSALLVVSGLRHAPPGRTYEIWVMKRGRTPQPAGLFAGGVATRRIPLRQHVPAGSFVGVTLEHAGGAPQPSESPLFVSATA